MPETHPTPDIVALNARCEQLAQALLASETHQSLLFDCNPLPVWVYDVKTLAFLAVNESAVRNYGYSREEFLGFTIRDIRPASELSKLNSQLDCLPSVNPGLGSWVHRKKNGSLITVEIFSHDIVFEGRKARLVVSVDITTRIAAEEKLRRSEERFQLVSRATSDAIWDLDTATDALWWGDGFYTLFGYTREEVAPTIAWWMQHIHPDERERIVASLRTAMRGHAALWVEEYRYRRRDGSYATVQDRGHVIRDETGHGLRMVGGMTDITEHKKLLNQYLRAQRMESIGTLAGGIAHDLNNVLAPILMSIELLGLAADDNSRQLLATIEASARRGADLVRQVLTFSRGAEGGRLVALKAENLLTDIARIAEETFPRSIRTEMVHPGELWPITGDATQLHQVLLNLVLNARDAMPAGGVLTLSAENVSIDSQYAATSRDAKPGAYLCIGVVDTGSGIPAYIIERIFEPFFTTKEVGKGTGLGLSTAHAIVKSHGGFITVYSETGKGTLFKVYLPADPNLRPPETVETGPAELPRGKGETILVVDDETSILSVTRQTLEAFGYRVLVAHDGAEAVALYAQHRDTIAVVLTDMVMPIMDGPATISALMRINPKILIVAASGLTANGYLAKASGAGVKHFLPKPYAADTLLITLRNVLQG